MESSHAKIHNVIQKLRVIFKATQAHSKYVEKLCGLSSAKLWMLHEVATSPGLKVSQLASVLSIHPSTCSNMLDKLEEQELISRDRSKKDQRSVHLYVTEQGKILLARAPQPPQGKLTSALKELPFEHLTTLDDELTHLVSVLDVPGDKVGLTPIANE
ncbi:MarR family winged helix-turn-helix transcriptional regulator [Desulfotalea psychrophila]|uniref:Related to transcriptional regulator (MarR family) n=1 Tax=Desulfotalea psychrophila (strain LSv54 / DSM 12343) TaxID=177439 RepID=Q6ART7_DESPS|nr:MarR family transcriptional regulator [Desulfotalea psychrophila]CAG34938.1 related to transcriptional regulator (MarR family) [Desulfotalea psychrophila LSv54]